MDDFNVSPLSEIDEQDLDSPSTSNNNSMLTNLDVAILNDEQRAALEANRTVRGTHPGVDINRKRPQFTPKQRMDIYAFCVLELELQSLRAINKKQQMAMQKQLHDQQQMHNQQTDRLRSQMQPQNNHSHKQNQCTQTQPQISNQKRIVIHPDQQQIVIVVHGHQPLSGPVNYSPIPAGRSKQTKPTLQRTNAKSYQEPIFQEQQQPQPQKQAQLSPLRDEPSQLVHNEPNDSHIDAQQEQQQHERHHQNQHSTEGRPEQQTQTSEELLMSDRVQSSQFVNIVCSDHQSLKEQQQQPQTQPTQQPLILLQSHNHQAVDQKDQQHLNQPQEEQQRQQDQEAPQQQSCSYVCFSDFQKTQILSNHLLREVQKRYAQYYPNSKPPSRTTIKHVWDKCVTLGTVQNKKHERKKSALPMAEVIEYLLVNEPQLSLRQLAKKLNVSTGTVSRRCKELGYVPESVTLKHHQMALAKRKSQQRQIERISKARELGGHQITVSNNTNNNSSHGGHNTN